MAPQTLATPDITPKLLDMQRVAWRAKTGIDISPGEPGWANGHVNKHPKANADIGSKTGEDIEVFIADPWPLDREAHLRNEKERRVTQGQGPLAQKVALIGGQFGVVTVLNPRQKHWTRSGRRTKTRLQRAARKITKRAGR